jgi:hypothetical protein
MRELPPDNDTRRKNKLKECFTIVPPSARRRADLFCFRNLIFLELAKGIEPPTL